MLSEFNGKIIVLWLTENFDANVTKVKISNYSATLTIPAVQYNVNQRWKFTTEDGVLSCLLYTSPSPRDGLLSRMPSSA